MKVKISLPVVLHILVALIAVFLITYRIDSSIARSDESIHATVAREIAFGASPWWRPTFFNALYLNKPPLQLWGTASLLHLFGDYNFVYRLIPAAAGVGSLLILYFWVKLSFGGYVAALSAVLFALTGNHVLLDHGMRVATQDSTLLFLTLLSSFLFYQYLFGSQKEKTSNLYYGSFVVGAACITKWIAGALPLIIFFAFLILTKEGREVLQRNLFKLFVAITIAVSIPLLFLLPHFLYEYEASIAALTWNLSERLIGKGFHNQDEWTHYLKHVFWKGSYGEPIVVLASVIYGAFKFKDPRVRFLLLWFVIPLFGYSALSSRLAWYFLPAAGSIWVLFGNVVEQLETGRKGSKLKFVLLLSLLLPVAFGLYQQSKRVSARGTIELDDFVEKNRGVEYATDFSRIDLSKDGSLGLTRRQIFYLNRLRNNSVEGAAKLIRLLPFHEFESDPSLLSRDHLCLKSENNKKKTLACLVLE